MDIKKCSTIELVNLLNDGLAKGISGAKICKDNNLARSSVLTRLKREGYVHDKENNQYIKEGEENIVKKDVEKKTTKKTTKRNTKKPVKEIPAIKEVAFVEEVVEEETNSLEEVEKKISKLREALQNGKHREKKETKVETVFEPKIEKISREPVFKENEIGSLNTLIKGLTERIEKLENNKTEESSIVTIRNTKETTTRSIRLYKEVNDKLNEYIKTNKEKKVIDVLSLAILEYINKK